MQSTSYREREAYAFVNEFLVRLIQRRYLLSFVKEGAS
jgi:hypothetical protein